VVAAEFLMAVAVPRTVVEAAVVPRTVVEVAVADIRIANLQTYCPREPQVAAESTWGFLLHSTCPSAQYIFRISGFRPTTLCPLPCYI
jgi:hypothetical protein